MRTCIRSFLIPMRKCESFSSQSLAASLPRGIYTRVQLADGSSSFIRRGITQWDSMLPKPFFLRVERSLILHLRAVKKVIAQDRDEVSVDVEGFKKELSAFIKPPPS